MLKCYDNAVTFSEFPDEIALCINISNCPGMCTKCSEPWLRDDIGDGLTHEKLDELILKHPGITLVGFMGGDRDHKAIAELADYVHLKYKLKVGFYSGQNCLDMDLLQCLNYYKIGEFRMFEGDESTWKNQTAGPICLPTSNQMMFKYENNKWINITDKFRKLPINDWKKVIKL